MSSVLACLLLLCFGGVAQASGVGKAKQTTVKSAWTLMIYMDADNSLETPQMANVVEMLKVGSSDKVQIVMLCDRSAKSEPKDQYTDMAVGGLPNWSGAKLLHVEQGKLKQLADWGDTNMADPGTLKKFLAASANAYPADHYGLIIVDHGSGWAALCVDESSGDKLMNLRDLRAGLEPFVAAHGKLDLVGLDACLMASFETAQALVPVVHVMVASEELEPGRGWNYDQLSKSLIAKPESTGYDLGRAIIDAFTIHFREAKDPMAQAESMGATLSMLNLDEFAPLQAAVSALADRCSDALHHGKPGWIKVARPRSVSEEFGEIGVKGEGGDEEMHDLMHLAQLLEQSDDPGLQAAAQKVDEAIRHLVTYFMHSLGTPHAGGISIYFPIDGISLQEDEGKAYLSHTFSRDARWVNFLSLYSVAVKDYAEKPNLLPVKASGTKAAPDKPIQVAAKCTDADLDKAHFLMLAHDGPDLLIVGRFPSPVLPSGVMGHLFDGAWFMLTNGKEALTCPISAVEILDSKELRYMAYVPGQIKRAGSDKWTDVQFTFLINGKTKPAPSGQLLYAFADTPQGPLQMKIQPGDLIVPVYTRLTEDGAVDYASHKHPLLIDKPTDFFMGWGHVGKGAYVLGFEVVNLAGIPAIQMEDFLLE